MNNPYQEATVEWHTFKCIKEGMGYTMTYDWFSQFEGAPKPTRAVFNAILAWSNKQ